MLHPTLTQDFSLLGLSPYNKIYEFPQEVQGVQSTMVMTSVSGHLLGMDFSEQYRKWFSCNPVQLFDLPVEKSCREDSMVKIKKTLEREVRGARMLIVWTDCDRLVLMLVSVLVLFIKYLYLQGRREHRYGGGQCLPPRQPHTASVEGQVL